MDRNSEKDIWFKAKRYGWGWGLPSKWQGWVVFVSYFVLLIAGLRFLLEHSPVEFTIFTVFITTLLIGICWIKGEKLRWRWGNEDH